MCRFGEYNRWLECCQLCGFLSKKGTEINNVEPNTNFCKNVSFVFCKNNENGFHPTRENVENYICWANEKEEPLPDSIIKQFTISVMNMNSNASFPND